MIDRAKRGKLVEWLVEVAILVLVFLVLEPVLKEKTAVALIVVAFFLLGAIAAWGPRQKWLRRAVGALMVTVGVTILLMFGKVSATQPDSQGIGTAPATASEQLDAAVHVVDVAPDASVMPPPSPTPSHPESGDSRSIRPGRVTTHDVEVDQVGVGDGGRVQIGNVRGSGAPDVGVGSIRAGSNADISIGNKTQ